MNRENINNLSLSINIKKVKRKCKCIDCGKCKKGHLNKARSDIFFKYLFSKNPFRMNIPIKLAMTKSPRTVSPKNTLTEVKVLLDQENFHHVPVVDENNYCVGIISSHDLNLLKDKFTKFNTKDSLITNKRFLDSLLVEEVMTQKPITLDVNCNLMDAVKLFLQNSFNSIVITQNNRICGILTPFDILFRLNLAFENQNQILGRISVV